MARRKLDFHREWDRRAVVNKGCKTGEVTIPADLLQPAFEIPRRHRNFRATWIFGFPNEESLPVDKAATTTEVMDGIDLKRPIAPLVEPDPPAGARTFAQPRIPFREKDSNRFFTLSTLPGA